VMIPLTNKQTMTIRNNNKEIRFIEPYFIKGNPNHFACVTCGEKFMSQDMLDAHLIAKHGVVCKLCNARFLSQIDLDNHVKNAHGNNNGGGNGGATQVATPATFIVEPGDLDKLAEALRKQVDAKPEVKKNIDGANIGVMTFNLIDIASTSVADNVAEDLTTSLMKSDFQTIERGQLDKVLKELKIANSGLIDPTTAAKIGEQTGCNALIIGSISDRGQFIVINSRILETKTGKTIAAERVECRKNEIKR
ncbi:MAG: FlgO family outer membrane protein, partial [bacterium]